MRAGIFQRERESVIHKNPKERSLEAHREREDPGWAENYTFDVPSFA